MHSRQQLTAAARFVAWGKQRDLFSRQPWGLRVRRGLRRLAEEMLEEWAPVGAAALIFTLPPAGLAQYYSEVRPVLVDRCMGCHVGDGIGWSMENPEETFAERFCRGCGRMT